MFSTMGRVQTPSDTSMGAYLDENSQSQPFVVRAAFVLEKIALEIPPRVCVMISSYCHISRVVKVYLVGVVCTRYVCRHKAHPQNKCQVCCELETGHFGRVKQGL